MSWNYRVLELEDEYEGKYFEIKEVYYNRGGKPLGYCDATVGGSDLEEIIRVLDTMKEDAHRAILTIKDYKEDDNEN